MKKIYVLTMLLLSAAYGWAQSYTVSGPRTYYSQTSAINTTLYFDFEKGKLVSNTDTWHMSLAATSSSSTIAFASGVEAQILTGTSFAGLTTAPASGYAATINNGLMATNPGMFFYDLTGTIGTAHMVTPRNGNVIVVKLQDGRYAKVEMLSLYRNAPVNVQDSTLVAVGTGFGYYSFRYLLSEASSTDLSRQATRISNLQVPASSATISQMVDFSNGDTTLEASGFWHFGIKGTTFAANTAAGYTAQLVSTAFNDITTATTITPAAIAWYNYNMTTHTISAKPSMTILFKDARGRNGKIVIESYYKNGGVVACGASPYYTVTYYYNPYGEGETLTGRNGSDLTATATLVQTTSSYYLTLSSSSLSVAQAGTTSPETINVTSSDSWTVSASESWVTLGSTSGSQTGSFTVAVAANAGTSARTAEVTVSFCTTGGGAEKVLSITQDGSEPTTATVEALRNRVKVYPNPSSGRFFVELGSLACDAVSVSNIEGQQLINITSPSSQLEFDTQSWNKGLYIMKISSAEGVVYNKIEIQ